MGQATEHAIRFSSEKRRPGHDLVYEVLAKTIGERVRTEPGMYAGRPQIFTRNGGAFHYEYYPYCSDGGLIEGATPECRGPAQLLLYQKAQEALLREAIPEAEKRLSQLGYPGKLGLLKNCRDAMGHVYGAQESFEVDLARGFGLLLYRLSLAVMLPLLVATVVCSWVGFLIRALTLVLLIVIGFSFVPLGGRRFWERLLGFDDGISALAARLILAVTWPLLALFSFVLRTLAFRRVRKRGLAFLVSRPVWSGSGSVEEDGRFVLSEKGPSINAVMRSTISPRDRAVLDTGNLLKPILTTALLHLAPLLGLWRRRQRLQLGLADSAMLEEAEFLKMGATSIVVAMIEAGALEDAPRLRRPTEALHAIVADPSLEAEVATARGAMTALEIQRFYLERAKVYVKDSKATSMEAREVVKLWDEVVTALERRRMTKLVGRVDWVTKRYLLETCGDKHDTALLKTIDLRYHELGDGYAALLEERGAVSRLVSAEQVQRAIMEPPEGTPAFTRGRFIRSRRPSWIPIRISWDSALVGGRLYGRLIRFPGRSEPN